MLVYFTCYTSNIVHADPISIDTVLWYTNHFQNLVGGGGGGLKWKKLVIIIV